MNRNLYHFLRLLWKSILFWTFAMFCYGIFRYYGLEQEGMYTLKDGITVKRAFFEPLTVTCIMGFGLGIVYAIVDFMIEKYMTKKISLGLSFLIKTFFHFFVTILVVSTIITFASKVIAVNVEIKFGWWLTEKRFWSALFYLVVCSFVLSFIKISTERFGKGMFLKILMGSYSNPKEEERILMFLDLKDSTTIAESLGHQKYSQFIQACFLDLNDVILEYEAEIYQYVGDEAVLSWSYKTGLKNNNCIGVFFAFQEKLESRRDYYLKKYEIYPEFKAGLHGGSLMVAEVGSVRKELAYHGDVINTSARIQAECNTYNVTMLLSEKLLKDLKVDEFSTSKLLGNVLLKGKNEEVKIHTIQKV